ncbi:kelch-like protein 1 [Oppia nitens]|uniref:kelch-like protein 1 n=1 Tax=Oppia nitens TaxID=1686743 RepID=UPI0023D9DE21|nr:kelch-like protein 1 [Oppia nitens]
MKFSQDQSLWEKFSQLDVNAHIKLSVLGGLIQLEGSARYLQSQHQSARQDRLSLVQSISTRYESVSLAETGYKRVINFEALDKLDVTHVVVGIQWGGNVVVTVEETDRSESTSNMITGALNAQVNAIIASITGSASVNYSDSALANISGYNFEIYGDILPDRVPQNLVDALIFMNKSALQLREANGGRGKQLYHQLLPVNVLRQMFGLELKQTAIIHEINTEIVDRVVQLFDLMKLTDQLLYDYWSELSTKWEPYLRDEVLSELSELRTKYSRYQSLTTRALSALLVKVRAGNESVDSLSDVLLTSMNDSYSSESMNRYMVKLDKLKNKLQLVEYVQQIPGQLIVDKHANLEKILLENFQKNIYWLFYSYDDNTIDYLDNIQAISSLINLITKNDTDNFLDNLYCSINYEIIDLARAKLLLNSTNMLINNNNFNKPKISMYKYGKLITDNVLPLHHPDTFIYVCGGYDGQNYHDKCYIFDIDLNQWSQIESMPTKRHHLKLITFNNKLYAIGGRNDISTNLVEIYDPITKQWISGSSMIMRREGFGLTIFDDSIYVCGGYKSDENTNTNSCEYFNSEINEWMFAVPMTSARDYHQLVVNAGYLYAIGGNSSQQNRVLNTVDKYDPASKQWTPVANMSIARSSFGSVSFRGKLYVCGGNGNANSCMQTCESYDPETNKWTSIASMQYPRVYMDLLVYNDKLYAIGGENINTIELYDYSTNNWSKLSEFPNQMWDFGVFFFI